MWGTSAASKSEFVQTARTESAKWNCHWENASVASMRRLAILSYSFKCSIIGDVSCYANEAARHNIHQIATGTIVHGRIRLTFNDGESSEGTMALVPQPPTTLGMGDRQTIKWDADDAGSTHTHATGTWVVVTTRVYSLIFTRV